MTLPTVPADALPAYGAIPFASRTVGWAPGYGFVIGADEWTRTLDGWDSDFIPLVGSPYAADRNIVIAEAISLGLIAKDAK